MATISALGHALLCALHREPLTGYELARRMRKPIGYYWTAQHSQIYSELARLEDHGLLVSEAEPGPGPHQRRTYTLTGAGRAALSQWLVEPPAPPQPRDELVLKTYALSAADPDLMRELYVSAADGYRERLAEYEAQEAALLSRGADRVGHPYFGAYATVRLGLAHARTRLEWCRWMAARLAEKALS